MRVTRRDASDGRGGRSLDTLDSKILEILQRDGRISYREVGRRLGVSEGTIRSRANRMQSDGVVTFAAIADPMKMGYRVMAFFLLQVKVGYQQSAIDALTEWPEITYISACIGRADLYVQVVCTDHDQLWSLLSERFADVEGVEHVETFQEIKMHKVSYVYPVTGMSSEAAGPTQE
ncbi:HTH-type transcriptional regulator Ptr2 [Brevibacterium yomogidense]|nr:Lrp/AsnC family transcriptional regulator [Brevibacterium yomogidense]